MKADALALLVARPGVLRDSLQAILATVPQIETVSVADDASLALGVGSTQPPVLVLVDADSLHEKIEVAGNRLMNEWPEASFVVLIDDKQQCQAVTALGVNKVIIKGFPAAKLIETIQELIT